MYRDPRDTRAQDARSPPRERLICRREDRWNLRPVPRCVIWVLNTETRKWLDVVNSKGHFREIRPGRISVIFNFAAKVAFVGIGRFVTIFKALEVLQQRQ